MRWVVGWLFDEMPCVLYCIPSPSVCWHPFIYCIVSTRIQTMKDVFLFVSSKQNIRTRVSRVDESPFFFFFPCKIFFSGFVWFGLFPFSNLFFIRFFFFSFFAPFGAFDPGPSWIMHANTKVVHRVIIKCVRIFSLVRVRQLNNFFDCCVCVPPKLGIAKPVLSRRSKAKSKHWAWMYLPFPTQRDVKR